LGRDEFSAGSFDEIFFAVGDGEISIGVDVADVAGLEPAIGQGIGGFFGAIPVAFETRNRPDLGCGSATLKCKLSSKRAPPEFNLSRLELPRSNYLHNCGRNCCTIPHRIEIA
jgi:hypothetical protein